MRTGHLLAQARPNAVQQPTQGDTLLPMAADCLSAPDLLVLVRQACHQRLQQVCRQGQASRNGLILSGEGS